MGDALIVSCSFWMRARISSNDSGFSSNIIGAIAAGELRPLALDPSATATAIGFLVLKQVPTVPELIGLVIVGMAD